MDSRQAIELALDSADMIVRAYLEDLTESELLVRAVPGTNHIAWQLGHLIAAERMFTEFFGPGRSPALPSGFEEQHNAAASQSDDPKKFLTKAEYLALYSKQRAATKQALFALSDTDLDKEAPEKFKAYLKSVGDMVSMQGSHWLMHVGQWAIIRRKLGRPPLF